MRVGRNYLLQKITVSCHRQTSQNCQQPPQRSQSRFSMFKISRFSLSFLQFCLLYLARPMRHFNFCYPVEISNKRVLCPEYLFYYLKNEWTFTKLLYFNKVQYLFIYPQFHEKANTLAESFCNVKNGSSIITSKSLSKNLRTENKHWCFCCLQGKTWIKIPIL